MKMREPYVAGSFYESDEEALRDEIEACFLDKRYGPGSLPSTEHKDERKIIGLVSPHAGYMYSGKIAANGYFQLSYEKKPDLVIIIGPNHEGIGKDAASYPDGYWKTPLGNVKVDTSALDKVNDGTISIDELSHQNEHSIEVQLPFLQYIYGNDFDFLPICLKDQSLRTAESIGKILYKILSQRDAIVVASTDFTHYETNEEAHRKDNLAIKAIVEGDPVNFYKTITENDISMCGYGAVATLLYLSKALNGKTELIKYATSGDIVGDTSFVVGYGSLKISRV